MGDRNRDRAPLAWEATLGAMQAVGARVYLACECPVQARPDLDLDALIAAHGAGFSLWDRRPRCDLCGARGHYMASPGRGTIARPQRSGPERDLQRQAFLRSFNFSRLDVLRIRQLAERAAAESAWSTAALDDLDTPFRVACCQPGAEDRLSGRPLGEWAGMSLIYWPMTERELEGWRRRRRRPKLV